MGWRCRARGRWSHWRISPVRALMTGSAVAPDAGADGGHVDADLVGARLKVDLGQAGLGIASMTS